MDFFVILVILGPHCVTIECMHACLHAYSYLINLTVIFFFLLRSGSVVTHEHPTSKVNECAEM
jgi:hypothetical protein